MLMDNANKLGIRGLVVDRLYRWLTVTNGLLVSGNGELLTCQLPVLRMSANMQTSEHVVLSLAGHGGTIPERGAFTSYHVACNRA